MSFTRFPFLPTVVTITGVLLLALLGLFNVHHHGAMNSAIVILYALTSSVAGFTAASLHRHFTAAASPIINKGSAKSWVWTVNLTGQYTTDVMARLMLMFCLFKRNCKRKLVH